MFVQRQHIVAFIFYYLSEQQTSTPSSYAYCSFIYLFMKYFFRYFVLVGLFVLLRCKRSIYSQNNYIPTAPLPPFVTIRDVSRRCQRSPGGQTHLQLESLMQLFKEMASLESSLSLPIPSNCLASNSFAKDPTQMNPRFHRCLDSSVTGFYPSKMLTTICEIAATDLQIC